jgi:hypothetical protein
MKLFDEIISLLSDRKGSLTDALLKTKVLMHKIGHKELAEWVNDELNGYQKGKAVPHYRIVNSRLVGHVQNIAYVQSNMALPTAHLSEKIRNYYEKNEMRQSISVIEELANNPKGQLVIAISPENYHLIDEVLDGYFVQKMWIQMETTQLLHCLTEIRSRLLDFALGLQDELGDVDDKDIKEVAKGIDAATMFQNMVVGDNATFVIGNQNLTTIKNKIKKGDFQSLASALTEAGVDKSDIIALETAVLHDGTLTSDTGGYGPEVKGWFKTMLGKVVDASWNIELGIASGLLTEGLKAYYF